MQVSNSTLYTILFILIALTATTYVNRIPTGDDAWFAEQSYWLQKEGVIRSEFFRGILGWEKQLLVSHKLFLAFGAGLIKLFGFGLPTVQFVGLISFCAILAELMLYIHHQRKLNQMYYLLMILILVFSNRVLIRLSFENRPELMLAALGFGSFLCINSEKNKLVKSALAGWLAALAILAHLNGVIYLMAGAGTYLFTRRYRECALFLVVGGVVASMYFIDIVQARDGFNTWYYQFRNDPATQNAFGLSAKLIVMLTFPRLFFESPEQAALSLLFLFVLWQQRSLISQLPVKLKTYSLLVLIAFWLVTKNGSGTYMPLFMPFMLAILYELYQLRPFTNWGLKLVLALYFIIGIYGTIELIHKNLTLGSFPTAYKNLRGHIPKHTVGLVPLTFFFDEYEQYDRLLSHENFTYHAKQQSDLPIWANQHEVDFILMDYKYRREDFYPDPGTPDLSHYKLTFFDGRFAIYTAK